MIRKLERKDKENWAKIVLWLCQILQSTNEYRDFRYSLGMDS